MRRRSCIVGIALVAFSGCGSSGATKVDAQRDTVSPVPEASADLPTSPADAATPDAGTSPQPDLATPSDAANKKDLTAGPDLASDLAPAPDLARADLGSNPPDASGEAGPRLDLASPLDATKLPDAARTDSATDAPSTTDVAADSAAGGATGAVLGGCQVLPLNHIFNTPIDTLPVHGSSAAFMTTIGTRNIHLDLGTSTDMASAEYYGIPYNIVNGNALTWTKVSYSSTDPDMGWDPLSESDCVDQSSGAAHTLVSPCLANKAPKPWLPIPTAPLVEGGIITDPTQPYGDHHMLIVDADTCRLWELYHCYPNTAGGWDIFGSSTFDLNSNSLRPADWTSADAAGFPILPLLLREIEASAGEIRHALRFTISSSSIRNQYVWPARHLTTNGSMSASLPPMGQLFRIKASYQIPSTYNTQSRAILQALKTYGMYIADGGSNLYIQGDPSAGWLDATFSQVQSVGSSQFEAVDMSPIMSRAGFDTNSAAVPAP